MNEINFFPKMDYDPDGFYSPSSVNDCDKAYVQITNEFMNELGFCYSKAKDFILCLEEISVESEKYNQDRGCKISNGASYSSWEYFFEDKMHESFPEFKYSNSLDIFLKRSHLDMCKNSGYKKFLEVILKNADDRIFEK